MIVSVYDAASFEMERLSDEPLCGDDCANAASTKGEGATRGNDEAWRERSSGALALLVVKGIRPWVVMGLVAGAVSSMANRNIWVFSKVT